MRTTCEFDRKYAMDLNALIAVEVKNVRYAGNVSMMMKDSIFKWLLVNKRELEASKDYFLT